MIPLYLSTAESYPTDYSYNIYFYAYSAFDNILSIKQYTVKHFDKEFAEKLGG